MSGANGLKNQSCLKLCKFCGHYSAERNYFKKTILNVFCDASQDAYGTSAHRRRKFEDDVLECRLVAGKGRVVPLKAQTI